MSVAASAPPTPPETLHRARKIALEVGLHYVYEGNIFSDGAHTYCPKCRALLIRRSWHDVLVNRLKNGKCEDVRIGFGGMAATPRRAKHAEEALRKGDYEGAAEAIARDFQPIDDWRGTASYRVTVAANLIRRLKLRIDGAPSIDLDLL